MGLLKMEVNDKSKYRLAIVDCMPSRNRSRKQCLKGIPLSPLFLSSAAQFFSKKKGPLMVITAFAAAAPPLAHPLLVILLTVATRCLHSCLDYTLTYKKIRTGP